MRWVLATGIEICFGYVPARECVDGRSESAISAWVWKLNRFLDCVWGFRCQVLNLNDHLVFISGDVAEGRQTTPKLDIP